MAMPPRPSPQPMADQPSLDLPPALASLMDMTALPVPTTPPTAGLAGAMMGSGTYGQPMPSFQQGGMVGPGGTPMPPPGAGQQPQMAMGGPPGVAPPGGQQLSFEQLQAEANRFSKQNPQQVQQIQAAVQQAMQSGELTLQELNMVVQMAMVALQNPNMYPQMRRLAIQQGLATEQDLSPQYDQGLLFALLLLGQTMGLGGQTAPGLPGLPGGAQMPAVPGSEQMPPLSGLPTMAKGGTLNTKSEPVKAILHTGEYVVPKHVVDMKGREFFDKLVERYNSDKTDDMDNES